MKMARASQVDIDVAMELDAALEALTGYSPVVPEKIEKPGFEDSGERFDRDDSEQCVRVLGYILDLANQASLMRVVWGCAVMLDPARPIEEWTPAAGPVLWWRFPSDVGPWLGTPDDVNWPGLHTHWTAVVVPNVPVPAVSAAPAP